LAAGGHDQSHAGLSLIHISNELSDSLIASILAADLPLDELCVQLVAAANQAGGRDNITCLVAVSYTHLDVYKRQR